MYIYIRQPTDKWPKFVFRKIIRAIIFRYIRFLCRYPDLVIVSILVIVATCTGITNKTKSLPDFTKPIKVGDTHSMLNLA